MSGALRVLHDLQVVFTPPASPISPLFPLFPPCLTVNGAIVSTQKKCFTRSRLWSCIPISLISSSDFRFCSSENLPLFYLTNLDCLANVLLLVDYWGGKDKTIDHVNNDLLCWQIQLPNDGDLQF